MALTTEQVSTLATDIENNTNPVIVNALAVGDNNTITSWYNQEADSPFYLWKTVLTIEEMQREYLDWSEVVALNTNDLLSLMIMTNQFSVNPSRSTIRNAFNQIFKTSNNTKAALLMGAKRLATNVQVLFAELLGGDGTEANPVMTLVESITKDDIRAAIDVINGG
jgi:hypothetical protein